MDDVRGDFNIIITIISNHLYITLKKTRNAFASIKFFSETTVYMCLDRFTVVNAGWYIFLPVVKLMAHEESNDQEMVQSRRN